MSIMRFGQSGDFECYTNPETYSKLGHFDLDPCAARYHKQNIADENYRLPKDDGLILPWHGRIFLNPPYKQGEIQKWLKRMAEHVVNGGTGITLMRLAFECVYFSNYVKPHAVGYLCFRGRVPFLYNKNLRSHSPSLATMLISYSNEDFEILKTCKMNAIPGSNFDGMLLKEINPAP